MEERKLLDFGDYPEIAIDGIGDLQFANRQAHVFLFKWKRIDGIWQPTVVATIVAPPDMINSAARTAPLIKKALEATPQASRDLLN